MGVVESSGRILAVCLMDTQTPQSSAWSDSGRKLTWRYKTHLVRRPTAIWTTSDCIMEKGAKQEDVFSKLLFLEEALKFFLFHTPLCSFLILTHTLATAFSVDIKYISLLFNYAMDRVCQRFVTTKVLLKHNILSDVFTIIWILSF